MITFLTATEIKVFLHESKEGKRIETQVYKQATYGKTRADVRICERCYALQ